MLQTSTDSQPNPQTLSPYRQKKLSIATKMSAQCRSPHHAPTLLEAEIAGSPPQRGSSTANLAKPWSPFRAYHPLQSNGTFQTTGHVMVTCSREPTVDPIGNGEYLHGLTCLCQIHHKNVPLLLGLVFGIPQQMLDIDKLICHLRYLLFHSLFEKGGYLFATHRCHTQ